MARYGLVVLKILLIFGGIGPLIGLLVFAFGMAVLGVIKGGADGLVVAGLVLVFGIIFAHLLGGVSALVAGGVAAFLTLLTGRIQWWTGLVSGLASLSVAMMRGLVQLPPLPRAGSGLDLTSFSTALWVVMVLVHLIAAVAAWEIARRLDLSTPKSEGLSRAA